MDDSGQDPRVDTAQAEDGTNSAATGVAADNAAAGVGALIHSAGAQSQTPPEDGGLREENARLQYKLLRMQFRMEVQEEKRNREKMML